MGASDASKRIDGPDCDEPTSKSAPERRAKTINSSRSPRSTPGIAFPRGLESAFPVEFVDQVSRSEDVIPGSRDDPVARDYFSDAHQRPRQKNEIRKPLRGQGNQHPVSLGQNPNRMTFFNDFVRARGFTLGHANTSR